MTTTKKILIVTVSEKAREALEGTATTEEAARRLLEMAKLDSELYRKIVEPYELSACIDAIKAVRTNERAAIWKLPMKPARENAPARALARANTYTILDFPLPGAGRLADATKAEILEAASIYRKQATDMAWKARWLEAIAAKLGRSKVSAKFTVEDLERLQKETQE